MSQAVQWGYVGYHTSGVLISDAENAGQQLISALRLGDTTNKTLSWLTATSLSTDGMSVGVFDGWWVLIDQTFSRAYKALAEPGSPVDRALKTIAAERTVLAFAVIGHSDVYGFALYEGGNCLRRWLTSEGSVELNEGERLPSEMELRSEREDELILELVSRFVPLQTLVNGEFQELAPRKTKRRNPRE